MTDFSSFIVSVSASIVASLIVLNLDKLKKLKPMRSHRQSKMPNRMRQRELQRSHPTTKKHPLSQR